MTAAQEYGAHVRSLIDFHLRRNGALVSLAETHPRWDDQLVRDLYALAWIGVEACGDESGPAMIEEAAERVALALLVVNYGPVAARGRVVTGEQLGLGVEADAPAPPPPPAPRGRGVPLRLRVAVRLRLEPDGGAAPPGRPRRRGARVAPRRVPSERRRMNRVPAAAPASLS